MRKITEITHSTHIAFPPILLRRKSSGGQASRLPQEGGQVYTVCLFIASLMYS